MDSKVKFVIFKISDNMKEIVVEEKSGETDYEVFREKLASSVDANGKPAPRYATYDVEYDLGGGEGKRCVFLYTPRRNCMRSLRSHYWKLQKQDHFHLLGSPRHCYAGMFNSSPPNLTGNRR